MNCTYKRTHRFTLMLNFQMLFTICRFNLKKNLIERIKKFDFHREINFQREKPIKHIKTNSKWIVNLFSHRISLNCEVIFKQNFVDTTLKMRFFVPHAMTTEWILKLKTVKRNRKTHYIQTQPIERKMERVRERAGKQRKSERANTSPVHWQWLERMCVC